jgi:hypothetical protein
VPIVEHSGALGGYRAHLIRFPMQHVAVATLCNLGAITPSVLNRRIADLLLEPHFSAEPPTETVTGSSGAFGSSGVSALLKELTGSYISDELQATFRITAEGGRLMLQRDEDHEPSVLQRIDPEAFRLRAMTLRFVRAKGGAVEALTVDAGRVTGIRFERQKDDR